MEQTILTHAQFVFIHITLFAKLKVLLLFLESYTSAQKCEGTIQGAEPINEDPLSLTMNWV